MLIAMIASKGPGVQGEILARLVSGYGCKRVFWPIGALEYPYSKYNVSDSKKKKKMRVAFCGKCHFVRLCDDI